MRKIFGGIILGAAISLGGLYATDNIPNSSASSSKVTTALSPMAQSIDQMFKDAYPSDQPGASVIVTKGGDIILKKGYGLANVEHNIAIKPHMTFRLGSITKQFTAVGILMLEQEGLLNISDNINVHLPDYPTHGETITIEHLLTHTSGIPSYTGLADFMKENMRKDLTTEEMLNAFKDETLDFKPGEKWKYNNSGYVILGAIIEKLSGQTYADFISTRIFTPLDMKNSHFGGHEKIIPSRVQGYRKTEEGYTNAAFLSMSIPYAAGSLLATPEDLLKWNKALLSEKLIPREALERAWKSTKLNNGELTGYGYGWGTGFLDGKQVVQHSGGIPGFNTRGITIPEDDIYVAVLSNLPGAANVTTLGQKAASIVLGTPIIESSDYRLTAEQLDELAGTYVTKEGDELVLTIENGEIKYKRNEGHSYTIMALEKNKFKFTENNVVIHFERDNEGKISAMVFTPWAGLADIAIRK